MSAQVNRVRTFRLLGLRLPVPSPRVSLFLWLLAVLIVFGGSLLPAGAMHRLHYDSIPVSDKLVHCLGYTVLALIPVTLLELPGLGLMLAASMIPMGIGLEFLQRMVPGRSFETGDMLADSLGVTVGVLIALSIRRAIRTESSAPARSA